MSKAKVVSLNKENEAKTPKETRFEWQPDSKIELTGYELSIITNLFQAFSSAQISDYERHVFLYQCDKMVREAILPRNIQAGNVQEVEVN